MHAQQNNVSVNKTITTSIKSNQSHWILCAACPSNLTTNHCNNNLDFQICIIVFVS
jgi:hypothetical protein